MTTLWLRTILVAVLACGGLALAPTSARAETPAAARVAPIPARAPTRAESTKYAEREQKSAAELETFEGGRVVLVITTLGAIILGVVLLLILL